MRLFVIAFFLLCFANQVAAQKTCNTYEYNQQVVTSDPSLGIERSRVEDFVRAQLEKPSARRGGNSPIVIIPVVVHILYHLPGENISDEKIYDQIGILNKSFRRDNADTVNTPDYFKDLAADCEIEFRLATSDPKRRATTGIIRKYTPIEYWDANDDMKFSSRMGDDGWSSESYLNIWVCNLRRSVGYSSFPGGEKDKDGIVVKYSVFGNNTQRGYEMGKTAVHEAGHWLGLRHTWGDAYCGDDWVDDTPNQGNFTNGCPTGKRISCGNTPYGDMYMNYMDLTSDACTNMFTNGQKLRMHAFFAPGGSRYTMLHSRGLFPPMSAEIPVEDDAPRWLHPQLYPNPASNEMKLDLSYDIRWVGKTLYITNLMGQSVMQQTVNNKIQSINIAPLKPGVYFLTGKKEDGATIRQKFIKM